MVKINTSHAALVRRSLENASRKSFQENQWGQRHVQAYHAPKGAEVGIVGLINSLAVNANTHRERFESGIGEDGFLGPLWANMIRNCRCMLNGECGRLDCGTLDGLLCSMLTAEDFDVEG